MCRIRPKFALLTSAALALVLAAAPGPVSAKPPKENGNYEIKVSGYYSGTGTARVTGSGVVITATQLKDDTGATHKLFAPRLLRDEQRHNLFRGRGTLDGMETLIDGRVDPADKRKGDVLKSGRILFTFKVIPNGRHGRGGGEKKDSGKQGTSDSGNPNPGNSTPGNPNPGNPNPAPGGTPGPATPPTGGGGPGGPGGSGNGNSYGNGTGTGSGESPGNENPGEGGNAPGNPNGSGGNPGTGGSSGTGSAGRPAGGRPQGGRPGAPHGRR